MVDIMLKELILLEGMKESMHFQKQTAHASLSWKCNKHTISYWQHRHLITMYELTGYEAHHPHNRLLLVVAGYNDLLQANYKTYFSFLLRFPNITCQSEINCQMKWEGFRMTQGLSMVNIKTQQLLDIPIHTRDKRLAALCMNSINHTKLSRSVPFSSSLHKHQINTSTLPESITN